MTTVRVGQRVRLVVEGEVLDQVDGAVKIRTTGGDTWYVPGAFVVTVLPEEGPAEPTNLGAVVESGSGELWIRWAADSSHSWINEYRERACWTQIVRPVVLHEGWRP